MTAVLQLLTGQDVVSHQRELAGLLYECPTDSTILKNYPNHLTLIELTGDDEEAKISAYKPARKLLESEPKIRGVRQLGIFEELVISELKVIFHLLYLHQVGVQKDIRTFRFQTASKWSAGLKLVVQMCESDAVVEAPQTPVFWLRLQRSLKRLLSQNVSFESLKREMWSLLSKLDPYHRRSMLFQRKQKKWGSKPKNWFYSTAYTFSGIGLDYEPFFPINFNYMVENQLTGGKRLRESNRDFCSIYEFASADMVPSAKEILRSIDTIETHLKGIELSDDEAVVRQIFLSGDWFQEFTRRQLPQGLFLSSLFPRWFLQECIGLWANLSVKMVAHLKWELLQSRT